VNQSLSPIEVFVVYIISQGNMLLISYTRFWVKVITRFYGMS